MVQAVEPAPEEHNKGVKPAPEEKVPERKAQEPAPEEKMPEPEVKGVETAPVPAKRSVVADIEVTTERIS